jgi:hypothetical protein
MSNIDSLVEQMLREADTTSQYNLSSYEVDASYEIESYLVGNLRLDPSQARKVAMKSASRPAVREAMVRAARANNKQGAIRVGGGGDPAAAAQFNITVTRNSNTIPQTLPVAIFGAADINNGYANILNANLGAGTTITSVAMGTANGTAQGNNVVITYLNGANSDTVTISSDTYPYTSLLDATRTDMFKMSKVRYSISDATQLAQFNQQFNFISNSMFGTRSSNNVSIGAYRSPDQFQAAIIDLNGEFDIDKETSIQTGIIQTAGIFSFTISAFVQKFYRQNSKGF